MHITKFINLIKLRKYSMHLMQVRPFFILVTLFPKNFQCLRRLVKLGMDYERSL